MSSLILPRHWRVNWPMLMGHLALTAGHLTRTASGHLAECACFCTAIPSSVTFTGATGCLSDFNSTFALSYESPCIWGIDDYTPSPSDPCGDGCAWGSERFWRESISTGVTLTPGGSSVTIITGSIWKKYTWSGGVCYGPSGSPGAGTVWTRADCTNGSATLVSSYNHDSHLGTHPTACTIAF